MTDNERKTKIRDLQDRRLFLVSNQRLLESLEETTSLLMADLKQCWSDWANVNTIEEMAEDGNFFVIEKYKHVSDANDTIEFKLKRLNEQIAEIDEFIDELSSPVQQSPIRNQDNESE